MPIRCKGDNEHIPCVITMGHDERSSQLNDVADPLVRSDYKQPPIVCYALGRASFNQGKNAAYEFEVNDKVSPPLMHRGPGGVCTPACTKKSQARWLGATIKEQAIRVAEDKLIVELKRNVFGTERKSVRH